MKIVVTGGAGFIGSNIALELDKKHDVTVIDDFSNADFNNLKGFKGNVFAHDLTEFDWGPFFEGQKIDVIFHEAAITDTTVADQGKMMNVNVNAFKRILDFSSKNSVKVIYASSAAVYGRGKSPMNEDQELSPLNIYGFSKYVMENLASDHIRKNKSAKLIGLRYFNVFGPNEKHKNSFASMIHQLSLQMKAGKRPRVFRDGGQTRDHIYIKDVVQANMLMLGYEGNGIFNCGTGIETSFNDVINYLNKALKTNLSPEYIDNPYGFFQDKTCADISKIAKEVGFRPKYTVKTGIDDYFKNHE